MLRNFSVYISNAVKQPVKNKCLHFVKIYLTLFFKQSFNKRTWGVIVTMHMDTKQKYDWFLWLINFKIWLQKCVPLVFYKVKFGGYVSIQSALKFFGKCDVTLDC